MTSIESTMASQINLNGSNNDEESIFLSSSDDDKDHESVDRDEYLAQEHLDDENAGYDDDDASDNDDFAYGNSYDDEDAGRERRPIKVYDEYDPENIDNNEEYSDDDDIPLNLYSRKKKQQEASESQSKEDSDVEELDQSSSDEERPPKKRGRPKRAQQLVSSKKPRAARKPAAKPLSARKKPSRTATNSDSDSNSSAAESDPKSKHAKKNPTKENVNNDCSSIKNLVKKTSNNHTASLSTTLGSKQKTTKLSQAQNIISGRVINFESGFKIPKRPSNESNSGEKEPPEKKTKVEPIDKQKTKAKDSKETVKQKTSSKSPSQISSKNSMDKKSDKKIQPVKNGFKESADFLEALSSSSSRKHSHSSKKPTVASVAKVEPAKNESSQDLKKPEPSLKTNLESTCNSTPCLINRVESLDNSDSTSLPNSHSSITTTTTISTNNTSTTISTIGASSDSNLAKLNSNGPKSNLIISGSRKVAKKKVIWADSCSQQLESVQFFYLDESERVIKKEAYHGADMSKVDKLSEKEFTFRITSGHGFADFNEETASTWPACLVPIDLPESTIIPDIKSIERDIQAKREANTLAVLVFKKFMPDSASEPDPEPAVSEPPSTRLIPLEEVNGADTKLSDAAESDKPYTPSQEVSKAKPALLSHPTTTKTPLLPTPPPPLPAPVQPPSSSSDASGSKTEPANILNMLNLSNLSSSLLRSNEDAERLKKILSLVGTSDSAKSPDDKFHEFEQPPNKNNIPKTDTNNNPRWNSSNNNNNNNWQTHNKYSNQTFNRNYNQNSNQNSNNYNQGRNVFVNNFKRGIGNRAAGSFGRDGHAHNYRGNDSRGGFNRQNYAMHGQNRSRFGENKNYAEESDRVESKSSSQGGRWI